MKRYWCSWWSGYYLDEGCSMPPFQIWLLHERARNYPDTTRTEVNIYAVIDSDLVAEIESSIQKYFPDYSELSIEEKDIDFQPDECFINFENKTLLK